MSNDDTTLDIPRFFATLDQLFADHASADDVHRYLTDTLQQTKLRHDDAGVLAVLNELMGWYRAQGRHEDNRSIVKEALALLDAMHVAGTDSWTTTIINAATAYRAAGDYGQAETLYQQALDSASHTLSATDRRMAALHNNLSLLYSDTQQWHAAQHELMQALQVLEHSSVDVDTDVDVAATHTNLALVLAQRADALRDDAEHARIDSVDADNDTGLSTADADALRCDALSHATRSLDIYRRAQGEGNGHFASALAGYAQVCFSIGLFKQAVDAYERALALIGECYGTDAESYGITQANLNEARQALHVQHSGTAANADTNVNATADTTSSNIAGTAAAGIIGTSSATVPADVSSAPVNNRPAISGLALSRAYWQEYGKPLIEQRYAQYASRIAAGLIGHGSECYGFDDNLSHDHDFGPGFCLWLTDEDYAIIGEALQADYERLPSSFMGFGPAERTPRAQGDARRVGVFAISDFFASITGYAQPPSVDKPHEWLLLDEPTLAAATNGEVFADPLGALLSRRQAFKTMPDDVRLSLVSRRLGMMAQAGQYNLARMLARGDGMGAWMSIREFIHAATSLVFLINTPISAGYMPYYKWQFAALRRLSARMATRLATVCERLETMARLSSAACFGGAGFGEGGKGSTPAAVQIQSLVDGICADVVDELRREGLTTSRETFLEWQRPYVESHIVSDAACLHSLPAPATPTEHGEQTSAG